MEDIEETNTVLHNTTTNPDDYTDDDMILQNIETPTVQERTEIMSMLSEGMNEVPYHRYAYGNHAESERLYLLASIGPRYDKDYADANPDMSQFPKACETWALKSKSDGRINSIMFFSDPRKTYSDDEYEELYEARSQNNLSFDKCKWWNETVIPTAIELGDNLEEDLGTEISKMFHVTFLTTDRSCRSKGYGKTLLSKLTNMSDESKYPVWLYTTDRTTRFYEKAKLREHGRKEVNMGKEGSIPIVTMRYLPEGWQDVAGVKT
ncbi:hypothetical protein V866_007695 [Kwoniella sp. B9012]